MEVVPDVVLNASCCLLLSAVSPFLLRFPQLHGTQKLPDEISEQIDKMKFPIAEDKFVDYAKSSFPALLLPAWKMQNKLRDACLGEAYWKAYTERIGKTFYSFAPDEATIQGEQDKDESTKAAWLAKRRSDDDLSDALLFLRQESMNPNANLIPVSASVAFLRKLSDEAVPALVA